MNILCPTCGKKASNIRTAIKSGKLVTTCENCSHLSQPHQLAASNRRQQQKKDYAKAIVQPQDGPGYSRAYPDQARELYGDDAFRRMS